MLESDPKPLSDDPEEAPTTVPMDTAEEEGNRPAANARVSSPTEALTDEFGGEVEAEDFLGLEGEVEALKAESSEESAVADALDDDDNLDLAEGWLLELEDEGPSAGPVTLDEEPDTPTAADGGTEEYDEYEDEEYDEYHDENEEYEDEVPVRQGVSRRLVAACFLAGIAGTAVMVVLESDDAPEADLSARLDTSPVDATQTNTGGTGPGSTTTSDPLAGDTSGTDSTSLDMLDGLLATTPGPTASGVPEIAPAIDVAFPDISGITNITPQGDGFPGIPAQGPTTQSQTTLVNQLTGDGATGETPDYMGFESAETGLIWTGIEVPMDAVQRPGRLLTPAVGPIRATMHSGEIFEGVLYAVGGNRVWIEIGPGRVGIDGTQVAGIERLMEEAGRADDIEVLPGQRVRVRTAGGVLYGKVKSRDGDRVTMVTDKGGRITLVAPIIEPIGRVSGLVLKP